MGRPRLGRAGAQRRHMAEWQLGCSGCRRHREPCRGFRSGSVAWRLTRLPSAPRRALGCTPRAWLVGPRPVWRDPGVGVAASRLRRPSGRRRSPAKAFSRNGALSKWARVPQAAVPDPPSPSGLCLAEPPGETAAVRQRLPGLRSAVSSAHVEASSVSCSSRSSCPASGA